MKTMKFRSSVTGMNDLKYSKLFANQALQSGWKLCYDNVLIFYVKQPADKQVDSRFVFYCDRIMLMSVTHEPISFFLDASSHL